MTLFDHLYNFVVADSVHVSRVLHGSGVFHSNEFLAQRHQTKTVVEVKQSHVWVHPQEPRNVHIVLQSR